MTKTARDPRHLRGGRPIAVTRVPVPDLCCLWAETDASPMNIALVGTLDAATLVDEGGGVSLALIRDFIAAHLAQAPMLRRVVRRTRPGQGRPVWIDAAEFSIDQHVVLAQPGHAFADEQEFLDWCARETVRPLDRSRPLWRISIVPGLPDRRLGFLVVVHHVVADGLRGVAMIASTLLAARWLRRRGGPPHRRAGPIWSATTCEPGRRPCGRSGRPAYGAALWPCADFGPSSPVAHRRPCSAETLGTDGSWSWSGSLWRA